MALIYLIIFKERSSYCHSYNNKLWINAYYKVQSNVCSTLPIKVNNISDLNLPFKTVSLSTFGLLTIF